MSDLSIDVAARILANMLYPVQHALDERGDKLRGSKLRDFLNELEYIPTMVRQMNLDETPKFTDETSSIQRSVRFSPTRLSSPDRPDPRGVMALCGFVQAGD